jgi:hypothetical protein
LVVVLLIYNQSGTQSGAKTLRQAAKTTAKKKDTKQAGKHYTERS